MSFPPTLAVVSFVVLLSLPGDEGKGSRTPPVFFAVVYECQNAVLECMNQLWPSTHAYVYRKGSCEDR
eukprot:scaffold189_cov249-Pinguiococcus_pyrenoidosus.AAC.27